MMASLNGNIFRVTGLLFGDFTGHRWISHTKASDAEHICFFFICAWTNAWVNNRDAGDLRHHRTHYDVIVMGRLVSSIYWYYLPISISSARSTRKVIQVPARAIIMTTLHAQSPMIPVKACTTSWKEFLRQMSLQCASIKSPTSVTSNDICGNIALHYPAIQPKPCFLNNCGIVTPYGHSELDQHCLR